MDHRSMRQGDGQGHASRPTAEPTCICCLNELLDAQRSCVARSWTDNEGHGQCCTPIAAHIPTKPNILKLSAPGLAHSSSCAAALDCRSRYSTATDACKAAPSASCSSFMRKAGWCSGMCVPRCSSPMPRNAKTLGTRAQ